MRNPNFPPPVEAVRAASETYLLVAITFHFKRSRLRYFAEVVRHLSQMPVRGVEIHVFINAAAQSEHAVIMGAVENGRIEPHYVDDLSHPYDLAWAHKPMIREVFLRQDKYSHFLYLEDDEVFTFANLVFFLRWREPLRPFGLLPGFYRIEWNEEFGAFVSADLASPTPLAPNPHVRLQGLDFFALANPYCGCFLLDRSLAEEYVASASADRDRSAAVSNWRVRERAAMGLTSENPPEGFWARLVVPATAGGPPPEAAIRHLPDTFALRPLTEAANTRYGKLRVVDLFEGDFDPERRVNKEEPSE